MNDRKPFVVLAAGGTGGHMFPAQSVAESFAQAGWDVALTTDDRGMRYGDQFAADVRKLVLPTGSFSQGSIVKRASAPIKILQGVRAAMKLFSERRPECVIGFGGYPAAPALAAARLKGIPYYIHEQNAVLGRVNKLFQSKAQKVACGLWPVQGAGENAVYIGNPVRANVLALHESELPQGDALSMVVFGGSQGASVFSRLLPQALENLPFDIRARLKLTQQARAGEVEELSKRYEALNIDAEIAPFFDNLPERIAGAHFVIARAGASTIAELQIIGRGAILVPLPTAMNDHQRLNAKAIVAAGAALEFDEEKNSAQELADWIENTVTNRKTLMRMADAAARMARPSAASDFVNLIVKDRNHDQ